MQHHVHLTGRATGAQHKTLLKKTGDAPGTHIVAAELVATRTELSPSDCIEPPAKNKHEPEHPLLQNRIVEKPEQENQPEWPEGNKGTWGKQPREGIKQEKLLALLHINKASSTDGTAGILI